jgi:hypothetical protein
MKDQAYVTGLSDPWWPLETPLPVVGDYIRDGHKTVQVVSRTWEVDGLTIDTMLISDDDIGWCPEWLSTRVRWLFSPPSDL